MKHYLDKTNPKVNISAVRPSKLKTYTKKPHTALLKRFIYKPTNIKINCQSHRLTSRFFNRQLNNRFFGVKRRAESSYNSLVFRRELNSVKSICPSLEHAVRDCSDSSKAIDELKNTIKSVTIENLKLKQLSKEIMLDQHQAMASTVHSFYQNVVIPDSAQNFAEMEGSIVKLKQRIAILAAKNIELANENKRLRNIIGYYKNSMLNQVQNDSQLFTKKNTVNNPLVKLPEHPTSTNKELQEELELIGSSLKKIAKVNTISELINKLYMELNILLEEHLIGIFIVDPVIKKLYQTEKGLVHRLSLGQSSVDLAINAEANYSRKPLFASIEIAKISVRSEEFIVIPSTNPTSKPGTDPYLIFQLENKSTSNLTATQWVNHPNNLLDQV